MKIRLAGLVFVVMSLVLSGAAMAQDEAPHWTYEGEEGPDHWGELGEMYATCSTGHEQSPIDIKTVDVDLLPELEFSYQESALNIFNNGHTIQVNYDEGSSIVSDGETYNLLQFHFHTPSEHTINGETFPMELHLVHRSEAGELAVVGIMLQVGSEDSDNEALLSTFENLPVAALEAGTTVAAVEGATINAANFLPESLSYLTYNGSLTTPPCSEGVKWHVLTEPVTITQAEFDAFSAIYSLNARPPQPLFERAVLLHFSENG